MQDQEHFSAGMHACPLPWGDWAPRRFARSGCKRGRGLELVQSRWAQIHPQFTQPMSRSDIDEWTFEPHPFSPKERGEDQSFWLWPTVRQARQCVFHLHPGHTFRRFTVDLIWCLLSPISWEAEMAPAKCFNFEKIIVIIYIYLIYLSIARLWVTTPSKKKLHRYFTFVYRAFLPANNTG